MGKKVNKQASKQEKIKETALQAYSQITSSQLTTWYKVEEASNADSQYRANAELMANAVGRGSGENGGKGTENK